jgi:hypothetical protein
MKFLEIIQALLAMPAAIRHIWTIKRLLKKIDYQQLLNQKHKPAATTLAINTRVKSYFWACRLIPNCRCLPRSVALYQSLKAAGYQVTHRFGVNRQGPHLAAHAWVEYQQQPLNEAKDLYKRFKVMQHPEV